MAASASITPTRSELMVSIVVPCYRSGAWLAELVERIDKATIAYAGRRELILVDDASPDRETWRAVEAAAEHLDFVRGLSLARNSGQYRALLAGLGRARGELVVTLDDDLQTPPEEIPKLLKAALQCPDIDATIACYDVRLHSLTRRIGSRVLDRLYTALSGKPPGIQSTSFRVLRRSLVRVLCAQQTRSPMLGAMIFECTQRVQNVPVEHHARAFGESGYSLLSLARLLLTYAFTRSAAPLHAIVLLGAIALGAGALGGCILLARLFLGGVPAPAILGAASLATALAGAIVLGLGIVGEYVHALQRELTGPSQPHVRAECGAH